MGKVMTHEESFLIGLGTLLLQYDAEITYNNYNDGIHIIFSGDTEDDIVVVKCDGDSVLSMVGID